MRIRGSGPRDCTLGFLSLEFRGLGFRFQVLGFRVSSLGLRVERLGKRVSALGLRVFFGILPNWGTQETQENMWSIGLYWGYIGRKEKKMETTILWVVYYR